MYHFAAKHNVFTMQTKPILWYLHGDKATKHFQKLEKINLHFKNYNMHKHIYQK